ncbi:hypothetical protein HELRODRAFT_93645 [Helobdella robusta]|uniref:Endoplasmic reticulum vesicle transporter C-terminal domain-containing protein n=1 Tax=Helobdella robusta TaxID=6412 RepID=T1G8X1_HELRO|nr:hypothetical protein HELRODRAFT_93645 [Helobdella robusta]ESO13053.1 hypothetical protein HELRODRAFT_93645 [Helobdella robusta]
MSILRQRKNLAKIIQEFDAFPKVEEDHQECTASGGGLSLVVFSLITMLVVFEINYFLDQGVRYEYDIDPNFDKKLKLNIDIMVAMKCSYVGADILDILGENADKMGNLEEQSMNFDLTPSQQVSFKNMKSINDYARQEYHSIHEHLWKSQLKFGSFYSFQNLFSFKPDTSSKVKEEDVDGCRFHGSLEVNKVAGNFHITAGKSLPVFPRGHVHLSFMMRDTDYNFSHRILHFSFGDENGGIINPLDAEEKITHDSNHIFQYFVQVVPTVQSHFSSNDGDDAYQYAVTEQNRTISHAKGSHGLPGIYIKYDLSPLRVKVVERSTSLIQLLIRLCGIIGGIYSTSGIIHLILTSLIDFILCKRCQKNQSYRQNRPPKHGEAVPVVSLINPAGDTPNFQEVPLNGNVDANGNVGAKYAGDYSSGKINDGSSDGIKSSLNSAVDDGDGNNLTSLLLEKL